ncbi:MAG: hypothetical protein JXA77_02350 [Bacteroidales bacterium]|nr:hypothetical protein [Bacteroidales bacterium]MBN2819128.1 hypothetical protein [Bacteroidales bacterium]
MSLRRYRKLITAILILWIITIGVGLLFSRSMQTKVVNMLSKQANRYIQSEIHIRKSDIHFSVFKRFPLASIELRNVCVKIPAGFNTKLSRTFKGDTLLFARNLYLQLNLFSLFSDEYDLQRIEINKGYLQILTDKAGNSSLDILRKNNDSPGGGLKTRINAFSMEDVRIYQSDFNSASSSQIFIKKANVSGEFAADNFAVKMKSSGKIEQFTAKGQSLNPYQSFDLDVSIGNKENIYRLDKGYFSIGNIPFRVVGSFRTGSNKLVDLIFSAQDVSIRQIDKTLFKGLMGENGYEPKSGIINIQATLKGYISNSLPAIHAGFTIKDGRFHDKKHSLMLQDVFVEGRADNGNSHLPKSTSVSIDTLSFRTDKSYQTGKIKIQNLINPQLSIVLRGKVSVDDLLAFISIPNINIFKGNISNNLALQGEINKDADQKNKIINNLQVAGQFLLEDLGIEFYKYNIPKTLLTGQVTIKNKHTIRFDNLLAKSADSDIRFDGELANFLKEGTIPCYTGEIHSGSFIVDNFLVENGDESKDIVFPDSVAVNARVTIDSFYFADFQSRNFRGDIRYQNKNLKATNMKMDGFEGSMTGFVNLKQIPTGNISLYADGKLTHVNINQLFIGCRNFAQNIISSENLEGYLSGDIIFSSEWTSKLDFIPATITGQGIINLKNGSIKNYEPLLGLSDFIKVDELKHIKFSDLNTTISIRNEQVILDQTHISSTAIRFDGSGQHGFDNKYEYRLQVGLSDVLWGKARKKNSSITEFGYILDDGVGHTILPVIISGKGTTFDVKFDKRKARSQFKEKIADEKNELRELFSKEQEKIKEEEEAVFKLQTTDEDAKTGEPVLEKTDSETYRNTSDDFILEWDDSDDEED